MFVISKNPLVIPDAIPLDALAGGVVTFVGHVRALNEGKPVIAIDYEAYIPLAEKEGAVIVAEAREKFPLYDARVMHRVGHLVVGDAAIWVYTASMHRREAFQAAEYIVHEIKHRVPIWKKEYYQDGDKQWVRCTHHP